MKNLCKYALIAAIAIVFFYLLRVLDLLGAMALPSWLIYLISILCSALFVGLYCGLLSVLASNSPLKTPSLICTGGYGAFIVSSILYFITFEFILKNSLDSVSTWIAVAKVVDIIGTILIVVGLFWMSKYFTKGSSQQIATFILAIVLILILCFTFVSSRIISGAEKPEVANKVYSFVVISLNLLASAFFMFEFSKLKK